MTECSKMMSQSCSPLDSLKSTRHPNVRMKPRDAHIFSGSFSSRCPAPYSIYEARDDEASLLRAIIRCFVIGISHSRGNLTHLIRNEWIFANSCFLKKFGEVTARLILDHKSEDINSIIVMNGSNCRQAEDHFVSGIRLIQHDSKVPGPTNRNEFAHSVSGSASNTPSLPPDMPKAKARARCFSRV